MYVSGISGTHHLRQQSWRDLDVFYPKTHQSLISFQGVVVGSWDKGEVVGGYTNGYTLGHNLAAILVTSEDQDVSSSSRPYFKNAYRLGTMLRIAQHLEEERTYHFEVGEFVQVEVSIEKDLWIMMQTYLLDNDLIDPTDAKDLSMLSGHVFSTEILKTDPYSLSKWERLLEERDGPGISSDDTLRDLGRCVGQHVLPSVWVTQIGEVQEKHFVGPNTLKLTRF